MKPVNYISSVGLVLSMLFGVTSSMASDTASKAIMVQNPHVREVPAGQPNSAAFMTLMNHSGVNHAVVSAESSVAKVVELHTHIKEGGMMKMRRIDKIDISANSKTTLKPGGLHVMLIGLKKGLTAGEKVSITLVYEDGSRKEISTPVRKINMPMKKMVH